MDYRIAAIRAWAARALTRMVTFEEDGGVRSERGHDHRVILREDEDRVELRERIKCRSIGWRSSSGGGGGGERPERAAGGAASSHGAGLPGDEGEGSAVSGCSAEGEAQDYLALLEAHMQAGGGAFRVWRNLRVEEPARGAAGGAQLHPRPRSTRARCPHGLTPLPLKHSLTVTRMLKHYPPPVPPLSPQHDLCRQAAHPSPLVRAEAVAALHAFALLHAPSARSHLPLLHAAPRESAHPGVQMAAVRALADLLLWHRSAALLPDVAAPGLTLQRAGGARGGGRAVAEGSVDVLLGLVPLAGGQVDIEAVREDVEHAGRQAEGEDEGEAEGVVGVVGEWLCKLLLADASRGEEGGVERGAEVRVERVVQVLLVEVYLCSESCTCVRAPLKTSCPGAWSGVSVRVSGIDCLATFPLTCNSSGYAHWVCVLRKPSFPRHLPHNPLSPRSCLTGHVNSSRAVLAELFNRRGRAASLQVCRCGTSLLPHSLFPVRPLSPNPSLSSLSRWQRRVAFTAASLAAAAARRPAVRTSQLLLQLCPRKAAAASRQPAVRASQLLLSLMLAHCAHGVVPPKRSGEGEGEGEGERAEEGEEEAEGRVAGGDRGGGDG
ncbi:unnamed protein product [Closterium sp. NIES-53]